MCINFRCCFHNKATSMKVKHSLLNTLPAQLANIFITYVSYMQRIAAPSSRSPYKQHSLTEKLEVQGRRNTITTS